MDLGEQYLRDTYQRGNYIFMKILSMRKKFFTVQETMHWNRLLIKAMEYPSGDIHEPSEYKAV